MSAIDLSRVDVHDYLERLGMHNIGQATNTEITFSCPFPEHAYGDENPSAYMNSETTAWICFGCHRKGNAVTFLSDLEQISRFDAQVLIRNEYDPEHSDPGSGNLAGRWREHFEKAASMKGQEPEPHPGMDESLIDCFDVDWHAAAASDDDGFWSYLFEQRGFDASTLDDWRIGYDPRSDMITIPVRDGDGSLVGVKGRAWRSDSNSRFRTIGGDRYGFPTYPKARYLFGLDRVPSTGHLILLEGEFNVISMHSLGHTEAVGIAGSSVSRIQLELIRWHADSVTLFFDCDDAGYDVTLAMADLLEPFMPVRVAPEHDGDVNDMLRTGRHDEIERCMSGAESSLSIRSSRT